MTHPSTIRRRARKAGEPPQPAGRKPMGTVAKVTCSLTLDPAAKARLVAEAKARGVSVSALVEAWAMSLPPATWKGGG